jgi:hypothetical protein
MPIAHYRLRPGIQPKLEALCTLYEGKKIIVGRDKLDVVKGVLQKVRTLQQSPWYYYINLLVFFFCSSAPSRNC